jgi:hypothetical protein
MRKLYECLWRYSHAWRRSWDWKHYAKTVFREYRVEWIILERLNMISMYKNTFYVLLKPHLEWYCPKGAADALWNMWSDRSFEALDCRRRSLSSLHNSYPAVKPRDLSFSSLWIHPRIHMHFKTDRFSRQTAKLRFPSKSLPHSASVAKIPWLS